MSDLMTRINKATSCFRCHCPACARDAAGENHGHICTGAEGCVDTLEKARNRAWAYKRLLMECRGKLKKMYCLTSPEGKDDEVD